MKITKDKLKKLINEELGNMVQEGDLDEGAYDWFTKSHKDWEEEAASYPTADTESRTDKLKRKLGLPITIPGADLKAADALRRQGASSGAGAPGDANIEQGLDKLLDDFRNGLLGLFKPQMAESTESEMED